MVDFRHLVMRKIALIVVASNGVAVVLSLCTQRPHHADGISKINNVTLSQNQPSMSVWLSCSKKIAWSTCTTFDISLPWHHWIDWYATSAGWVSVSGPFGHGSVDLPKIFRCWDDRQYQMRYDGTWNWTERRWFLLNPAKVYTKEWKCMCRFSRFYWQPIAFSPNNKRKQNLQNLVNCSIAISKLPQVYHPSPNWQ